MNKEFLNDLMGAVMGPEAMGAINKATTEVVETIDKVSVETTIKVACAAIGEAENFEMYMQDAQNAFNKNRPLDETKIIRRLEDAGLFIELLNKPGDKPYNKLIRVAHKGSNRLVADQYIFFDIAPSVTKEGIDISFAAKGSEIHIYTNNRRHKTRKIMN